MYCEHVTVRVVLKPGGWCVRLLRSGDLVLDIGSGRKRRRHVLVPADLAELCGFELEQRENRLVVRWKGRERHGERPTQGVAYLETVSLAARPATEVFDASV